MQDDEQVVRVLVDLRPLPLGEDVLDIELVEAEALGEVGDLERPRALGVDPGQPVNGKLGDARLGPLDDVARVAADSSSPKAWERGPCHGYSVGRPVASPKYVILAATPARDLWPGANERRRVQSPASPRAKGETMTRARGVLVLCVAGLAMLAAAPGASAAEDPGTFASARDGQLTVSSSVLVSNRRVEMMGGWINESQSCTTRRRLTVTIEINRTRGQSGQGFGEQVSGLVENCAEGGPNLGFQLRASDAGMACPDGTWKPGRYDFSTNTLHRARGLRAIADLFFRETDPC